MPVERGDLLELVTQLDKLANYSRDISGRIIGRKLIIPTEMQPLFKNSFLVVLMLAVRYAKFWMKWISY